MATFNPLTGLIEPSSTGEGFGIELGYTPSTNDTQLGMDWGTPPITDSSANGLFNMGSNGWNTPSGAEPGMMDMFR